MGYLRNHVASKTRGFNVGPTGGANLDDSFLTTVSKLVPGEAAAAYPIGISVLNKEASLAPLGFAWAWVVLGICVLLRWAETREQNIDPQWLAIVISSVSFILFVYTLDGSLLPVTLPANLQPVLLLTLLAWGFIAPALYRVFLKARG